MKYLPVLFNFLALLCVLAIFWTYAYMWPLLITASLLYLFAGYCEEVAKKHEKPKETV